MIRPSFDATIAALTLTVPAFNVTPPAEDVEIAELLAEIADHHQGPLVEPDDADHYGACTGCREPWPCPAWMYGEELALVQLGRAADRVWSHARPVLDELALKDRRPA